MFCSFCVHHINARHASHALCEACAIESKVIYSRYIEAIQADPRLSGLSLTEVCARLLKAAAEGRVLPASSASGQDRNPRPTFRE